MVLPDPTGPSRGVLFGSNLAGRDAAERERPLGIGRLRIEHLLQTLSSRGRFGCQRRLRGEIAQLDGVLGQVVEPAGRVQLEPLIANDPRGVVLREGPRPLPAFVGIAAQHRRERTAVDDHVLRQLRPGQVGQRGQDVGRVDQSVACTAGRNPGRAIHDERHVDAPLGQRVDAFSGDAPVDPAAEALLLPLVGAVVGPVVGRDEHQRVVSQFQFVQSGDEPADQVIRVTDHAGELFARRSVFVGRKRRGRDRDVCQDGRVVQQERLVAMPPHVVDRVIGDDIRPELAGRVGPLAVGGDVGVPVPFLVGRMPRFSFREEAVFVEPVFFQCVLLGRVEQVVDLPFAGDARGIARVPQQAGKRDFPIPIEMPAAVDGRVVVRVPARAERVSSGEQHCPARAADRRDVEVAELQTAVGKAVNIRCFVFLASVAAKPILADVVQQNEHDVRSPPCLPGRRALIRQQQNRGCGQRERTGNTPSKAKHGGSLQNEFPLWTFLRPP